jgi:hypothetical protein
MEIKNMHLSHLRNGEHYKFQFDFSQLGLTSVLVL